MELALFAETRVTNQIWRDLYWAGDPCLLYLPKARIIWTCRVFLMLKVAASYPKYRRNKMQDGQADRLRVAMIFTHFYLRGQTIKR